METIVSIGISAMLGYLLNKIEKLDGKIDHVENCLLEIRAVVGTRKDD